jgi:hypothetical protein
MSIEMVGTRHTSTTINVHERAIRRNDKLDTFYPRRQGQRSQLSTIHRILTHRYCSQHTTVSAEEGAGNVSLRPGYCRTLSRTRCDCAFCEAYMSSVSVRKVMSQLCLWQSPPQRPASYSFSGIRLLSPAEKGHSRVQILAIEPCYVVRMQCNTSQFRLSRSSFRCCISCYRCVAMRYSMRRFLQATTSTAKAGLCNVYSIW